MTDYKAWAINILELMVNGDSITLMKYFYLGGLKKVNKTIKPKGDYAWG